VAKFTLEKVRAEESSPSNSDEESDGSSVLKHFQATEHTKSKDNTQRSKASLPRATYLRSSVPNLLGRAKQFGKTSALTIFYWWTWIPNIG
jgi:hypothetical protein